jgi:hypothetical protein
MTASSPHEHREHDMLVDREAAVAEVLSCNAGVALLTMLTVPCYTHAGFLHLLST